MALVQPFAPGHVGTIEDQQHHIAAVTLTGSPLVTTAHQTLHLQPGAKLQQKNTAPPVWSPRSLWAFVTANENDPAKQGRVQVEFEFEPLHPQPSHQRAWLHTLTPYGGGQDPGFARLNAMPHGARASSYGGGFLSLPEVGERVLVQFCVAWDDDAIILGSVRHGPVVPAHNPKDTKRWRTPSGNEIALTTEGEGAEAKDVISLRVKGHVALEAQMSPGSEEVFLMCGENYVHLINKGGQAHVEVTSAGSLLVHAAGHLQLEGDSVQILAKGGKVGVKDTVASGASAKGATGDKTLHKKISRKKTNKNTAHGRAAHDKNHHGLHRTMHGSVADSPVLRGVNREAYARAIAQKESSGNYQDVGIFVPRKHESGYALGVYQFMSYRTDVEHIVQQKPGGVDFLARCAQGIKPQPDEVSKFFTPEEQEQLFSIDSQSLINRAARETDPTTGQPFMGSRLVERAAQMHFAGPSSHIDGNGRDGNNTSIIGYGKKVASFYNTALSGNSPGD